MPPEAKEAVDALTALLGSAGLGGVVIAIFSWLQAKKGGPEPAAVPTIGRPAMGQLGGMMVNDHAAKMVADAIERMTLAYERCTTARDAEARQARDHAETLHSDMRKMTDALETLSTRVGDRKP